MPVDTDSELRAILDLHTVAVVGASTNDGKAAHNIPGFLQWVGYEIIPINPNSDEVLGRSAYDSLTDVEEEVDIVQVFRPGEEVEGIVEAALAREDVRVIWLQPGIHNDAAVRRAEHADITVVQDHCMGVEYRRLHG